MKSFGTLLRLGAAVGTFAIVGGAVLAIDAQSLQNRPVLSYGKDGDVEMVPNVVRPGQKVVLRFKNTTWLRDCPSRFRPRIEQLSTGGGGEIHKFTPLDDGIHPISQEHPIGLLPAKDRGYTVPSTLVDGKYVLKAITESQCDPKDEAWSIRSSVPPVYFTVRAAITQ